MIETQPAPNTPETAVKEAPKPARPANCAGCNKSIKTKWYYRNGGYYCTKRCWKGTLKKEEEKPAPAA